MNPNTLFPHNLHAYNEIKQAFAEGKRKVCVEHATATGKSYLITAVSDHFERVVIIIPGEEVREQVRDTVIKLSPERNLMPYFITYQKLTEDNKAGLMESDYKNKYDLIVIDEYHHTGAKEWGKAIQALIDNNAEAKVFGTTATPERYSEGGRNMSEEFFDGNVASRLDLGTAWKRKVLMPADYIIAIEDSEKFHDEFIREIEESKLMDELKSSFKDKVKQLQHDYDLKGKEPGVVKNHLRPEAKRVIVFSKTISQAKKDERKVKGWLKQAGFKIAGSYVIDSNVGSAERERIRNAFQNNDFEGIKMMVAVNMLNEGVHVPDVDAVFFLRKTMSPTIHLQQMGRCMKLYKEGDHRPVVFDFCNNIKNVVKDDIAQLFKSERQSFDAWQDLEQSESTVVDKKPRKSKEAEDENFPRGINYSASDYELYEAFTRDLSNADWDKNYAEAKAFYEEHGRFPASKENRKLYHWAINWWINAYMKKPEQNQEKADMLTTIGYTYQTVNEMNDKVWMKCYAEAKAFYEEHGHFPASKENRKLYHWAINWWKNTYLKNPEAYQGKADMLIAIGYTYQTFDEMNDKVWMKFYTEVKTFYEEHRHFPTSKENKRLYTWALVWWKNTYLKNPEAYQEKADMLTAIGYTYQTFDEKCDKVWMKCYAEAKTFFGEHGHFPTPKENKRLYTWAKQWWRNCYLKSPEMHQEKAEMLLGIGFEWQTVNEMNDKVWMKCYAEAKLFYEKYGYFPAIKKPWAGRWWRNTYMKKPEQNQEKADMLTTVGYTYQTVNEMNDKVWMKFYTEVKTFYEEHRHFPTSKENKRLYTWALVWWKNTYLKNPEAYQEKADMLTTVGYTYQTFDEKCDKVWMKLYTEVKTFYEEHRHFPTSKENKKLYTWAKQWWKNTYLKSPEMHQEKANMLLAIGFEYKGKK